MNDWIMKLSLSRKAALASSVAILCLLAFGLVAYQGLSQQRTSVNNIISRFESHEAASTIQSDLSRVHANVYRVLQWSVAHYDEKKIDALSQDQVKTLLATQERIKALLDSKALSEEERGRYQSLASDLKAYHEKATSVMDLAAGDVVTATMYMSSADEKFRALDTTLDGLDDLEKKLSVDEHEVSLRKFAATMTLLVTVLVVAAALLTVLGLFFSRSIGSVVRALQSEAGKLTTAVEQGQLSVRGDLGAVSDEFRPIVAGINSTMDAFSRPIDMTRDYVDRIARGEVPPEIADAYQGEFDAIKQSLNHLIGILQRRELDVSRLLEAAVRGELSARADGTSYAGSHRKLIEQVNAVLDSMAKPVAESQRVMELLAGRDLTARVQGSYRGDHARMKDAVNTAAQALHDAMGHVAEAVGQVSGAAGQIASSSQQVASGASEQASSLEETSASLESMASMT
ncbi:MAG TPA: MCP four helix bundle domain-containing protein, partial [Anaeromyxobacteraceae bacterium]